MTPDTPCPRCGTSPLEAAAIGESEPRFLPACTCYPHPPACVCCRNPLLDGRCTTTTCPVFDVLQPAPITDPLWAEVSEEPERTIVAPSAGFERLAHTMRWSA